MNMDIFLEIKKIAIYVMDLYISETSRMLIAMKDQLIEVEISTAIIALIAVLTYKINTRSTMVSERVEKRDIKIKRMDNLIELVNLLLKYRELLENTPTPFSDSNNVYDIIVMFDHEFYDDLRAKEINKVHSVIVRKKDDYNRSLIISYRGEYEVEPSSVSIHRDPGLKSISSDWDEIIDALRSSINKTINFSDISNTLDELSRSSAESISEEFRYGGISRGNTSMSTIEGRRLKNAIVSIDIKEFRKALKQVTDINATDTKGRTFLHYAIGDGFWQVTKTARFYKISDDENEIRKLHEMYSNLVRIIVKLIDKNADVNAKDNAGVPAVVLASSVGNFRAINVLALNGADIELPMEANGLNALQVATARGDYFTVKALISHGARVDVRNGKDETPLHQALNGKRDFNLVKILVEGGSDIDAKNISDISPRELIKKSKDEQLIGLIGDR